MSTDISEIANPYDFSYPVSDPELFFGRAKELGEINYYLSQAAKTKRPVSLAVMGDRAAGKTSLLNIIEKEATGRGLFAVRIDLDESDIEDQLGFFFKLFGSLASRAFDAGYFGGRQGTTYSTYLDMVSAYVTPETFEFAPWSFPIQYARARLHARVGVPIDDTSFKEDLKKISTVIGKTIIFIFDECNVFKRDHYVLQKVRNIFMNLPGFMLVFSGTKELFPIMDEIFSPIVRQFKKIEIGPFTRVSDTLSCIRVPLIKARLSPKQIGKLLSSSDILDDIHALSSGRPYEIQLICHMLMRRCQMGLTKKFILNIGVLQEIRSELAIGQDLLERPLILAAKSLQKSELEALAILGAPDGAITFAQLWGFEFVIHGNVRWSKKDLEAKKDQLVSLGLLREMDSKIEFAGDQFERIYLKYEARQKQVILQNWGAFEDALLWWNLDRFLATRWQTLESFGVISFALSDFFDTNACLKPFLSGEPIDENFLASPIAEPLVTSLIQPLELQNYVLFDCRLSYDGDQSQFWFMWPFASDALRKFEKLKSTLNQMCVRAAELGWTMSFEAIVIERPDPLDLVRKLKAGGNEVFLARVSAWLGICLVEAYVDHKNSALAEKYSQCILEAKDRPRPGDANNMGYLAISRGDYSFAQQLLEQALQSNDQDTEKLLVCYNLGVCLAIQEQFAEAATYFKRAQSEPAESPSAGCIYVIAADKGTWSEQFHVDDIRPHIEAALSFCTDKASAN